MALFAGYLRMAHTMPINADGASNALQAWEMLHGNPILRGWTVTDVPFYATELVQYALIELVVGLHEDVFRIASAMTYTFLVLLAAALAKGNATGRTGLIRMGVAVAIMLLPMPGAGYLVAFGGPNHLGTGVPLILTWLVLERAPRYRAPAVAVLLALGQIGDPLVLFIGVLPLVLVSVYRLIRARTRLDAELLVAAVLSVVIGQLVLKAIAMAGGFFAHSPPTRFSEPGKWLEHVVLLGKVTAVNFGGYLPDVGNGVDAGVAVIRLAGLALAMAAVVAAIMAAVRQPGGDRVNQILAVAIGINVAAFVASTLPADLMSARQVSVVLPMGAALAGRICAGWVKPVRATLVPLAAVLLAFSLVFVWHASAPARHEPKRQITAWLEANDLTHGLGSYWNANDLTLISGGKVVVAPLIGGERIKAYRWESKADWYDPSLHEARFIVLDTIRPAFGTIEQAREQFGEPTQRRDFGVFAVLVYDHNLLIDLPAQCGAQVAPSMKACSG